MMNYPNTNKFVGIFSFMHLCKTREKESEKDSFMLVIKANNGEFISSSVYNSYQQHFLSINDIFI